jgi:hypothetical protein
LKFKFLKDRTKCPVNIELGHWEKLKVTGINLKPQG